ncbi:hypothetical protein VS868_12015 [Salinimicrobium sp. 3283s]|uniref:hypothetical protein n=1 Tax=Salinimicrobium sp. 3283s TaxID=3114359 RepID=UPI0031EA592E
MILVSELRRYVKEKEAQLAGVKSSFVVVEKDGLVKYLAELAEKDNQIMVAVMPDARSSGNEDNVKMNNSLGFFFLEKTDYSESVQDKWLDIFERTQETALEFTRMLIDEKTYGACDFNQYLDPQNMSITPETGLAGCNGWSVEFFFNTPL